MSPIISRHTKKPHKRTAKIIHTITMTKEEYKRLSEEQAQKTIPKEQYEAIREAIETKGVVAFTYTNRHKETKEYIGVMPIGYFITPGWTPADIPGRTFLWALHKPHGKKESFLTSRIGKAEMIPGTIQGITDPTKWKEYLSGTKKFMENL